MGGQIRRGRIWRFWGAPIFSPEVPKYLFFKGFWDLWTENRGAPKTPNSTTTGLTPHLRGPYPQYGWDFPEEIPEKFRKDPGNALRAFAGISLESTAGMPQTL